VPAPLDRLPLLARAGAIIPTTIPAQHDRSGAWSELTVLIYPSGRSSFTLYEDDGATSDYRTGHYALTELRCDAEPSSITVSVGAPQADAALIPDRRPITFEVFAPPPRVVERMGEGALPRATEDSGQGWWHDGHFLHVRVVGQPVTVRATW
jgi:alpha-glucosidase